MYLVHDVNVVDAVPLNAVDDYDLRAFSDEEEDVMFHGKIVS